MASALQNFIRLQTSFHLKNLNLIPRIARNPNIQHFGTKAKSNSNTFSKTALVLGSLGVGGGIYGCFAAPDRKSRLGNINLSDKRDYILKTEIPDIKPSREIQGPATDLNLDLTLYQYQNCPFCCKVRAFLDFYGIPYKVIEVNPVMRQQLKFSDYKKVPILIVKKKKSSAQFQLNDSSAIISILGTFLLDTQEKLDNILTFYVPYVYTDEKGKRVEEVQNAYFLMYGSKAAKRQSDESIKKEKEWRQWADNELVHILSPNVYRTFDEAVQAFNYFSKAGEWEKNFSTLERAFVIYVGATAMYFISKRLKKKYALKDDVRESLYDACNRWIKAIGSKQKFMGGEVPNLADLAVYGLLNSIEGCTAFEELLEKTKIGPWYFNVKDSILRHDGFQMIH